MLDLLGIFGLFREKVQQSLVLAETRGLRHKYSHLALVSHGSNGGFAFDDQVPETTKDSIKNDENVRQVSDTKT